MSAKPRGARVITERSWGARLGLIEGSGAFRPVVWSATGARSRSLHHIRLGNGARTVALGHATDSVYYVAAGAARVTDESDGTTFAIREGSMVHVDAGTSYRLSAGPGGAAVIVGGPCPVDPALYEIVRADRPAR